MEDLKELARELDKPGATLQALIRGYGPLEHRDVAEAALAALVRRCSQEDRGEAVQALVQRLHDSEGWDTYHWSIHLTALTPSGEPDPAAADALIAKMLQTAIEKSYYLLISVEQVVASDAQRCAVLSYLQDQLRRAATTGLQLAICRGARPFLSVGFDHSEFVRAAIDAAGQPDTSLSELREAVRGLPLSNELRARALDALQGRLATAAVPDSGTSSGRSRTSPRNGALTSRALVTRLETETRRPESLLGMLDGSMRSTTVTSPASAPGRCPASRCPTGKSAAWPACSPGWRSWTSPAAGLGPRTGRHCRPRRVAQRGRSVRGRR